MFEARHLHWKYWEPRADWQGSRSYAPGQARLADCWLDADDPEAWEALVQLAVQQAARDSAVAEHEQRRGRCYDGAPSCSHFSTLPCVPPAVPAKSSSAA